MQCSLKRCSQYLIFGLVALVTVRFCFHSGRVCEEGSLRRFPHEFPPNSPLPAGRIHSFFDSRGGRECLLFGLMRAADGWVKVVSVAVPSIELGMILAGYTRLVSVHLLNPGSTTAVKLFFSKNQELPEQPAPPPQQVVCSIFATSRDIVQFSPHTCSKLQAASCPRACDGSLCCVRSLDYLFHANTFFLEYSFAYCSLSIFLGV
jgi:hypothetical protein